METTNKKMKFALLSIVSNTILIIFKLVAGVLSGSVSIISEAIHSGMDLMASFIAFFSVKESSKPADKNHPFGHGKIENISALIEGILIFIAAGMIITEAAKKIIEPTELEQTNIAIAVMFISALINLIVSKKLYKVAKEEGSMALEADALHLKADVYTAFGVGIGLLLIKLTGFSLLDPIAAILVALMVIKEAWGLCKNAFDYLIDSKLSDEDEVEVENIIRKHSHRFIDYHKLKTRQSGNVKHIDFHITVNPEVNVKEVHDIIGDIKKDMNEALNNTRVNVHVDPHREN